MKGIKDKRSEGRRRETDQSLISPPHCPGEQLVPQMALSALLYFSSTAPPRRPSGHWEKSLPHCRQVPGASVSCWSLNLPTHLAMPSLTTVSSHESFGWNSATCHDHVVAKKSAEHWCLSSGTSGLHGPKQSTQFPVLHFGPLQNENNNYAHF